MKTTISIFSAVFILSTSLFANVDQEAEKLFNGIKNQPSSEIEKAFSIFSKKHKQDGDEAITMCVKGYSNAIEGNSERAWLYANSPKCTNILCCESLKSYMYSEGIGVEKDITKSYQSLRTALSNTYYLDSFSERVYLTAQYSIYKNKDFLNPSINVFSVDNNLLTPIDRMSLITRALAARIYILPELNGEIMLTMFSPESREKIGFDKYVDGFAAKYVFSRFVTQISNNTMDGPNFDNFTEWLLDNNNITAFELSQTGKNLAQIYKTKNRPKIVSDLQVLAEKTSDVNHKSFILGHLGFALMNAGQNDEALKVFTSSECTHNLCKAGLFTYTVNVEKNYDKAFAQLREMGIVSDYSKDGDLSYVSTYQKEQIDAAQAENNSEDNQKTNYSELSLDIDNDVGDIAYLVDKKMVGDSFSKFVESLIESKTLLKSNYAPHIDFLNAVYTSMNSTENILFDGKPVSIEERAFLALRSLNLNAYVFKNKASQDIISANYVYFMGTNVNPKKISFDE